MQTKVIAEHIILTQDDVDYLKMKASQYLRQMGKVKSRKAKIHCWVLYNAYWDLYQQNKDKVGK